eukprot:8335871-Pyramimonas_sp.AAC.1
MDHFYYYVFAAMLAMTVGVELKKTQDAKSKDAKGSPDKMSNVFYAFRNNYLVVYSLMMGASGSEE